MSRSVRCPPLALLALLGSEAHLEAQPTGPDPFAECDAQVAVAPHLPDSYRCYYVKATKAQAPFEAAAARLGMLLAKEPGNHWVRLNLGHAELALLHDRTEPLLREAAEGFEGEAQAAGEIEARVGLASFFYRRGRMDDADAEIERVKRTAEASGDPLLLARARLETARQLWRRGDDLGRAYRLAREAEAAAFPDGSYSLRYLTMFVLGAINMDLGRYDDAIGFFRRELEIVRAEGDRKEEATTFGNLVKTLLSKQEDEGEPATPETVALVREALEAAIRAGNRSMQASMRRELGDLLHGGEAIEQYRRGLALARELGDLKQVGISLRGLAPRLLPDDRDEAFGRIDEALEIARRAGDRWDSARAAMIRAHMRWEAGPREAAIADSQAALEAFEAIRDLQRDDEGRAGLMSRWNMPYYRFAGRLLESPSAERREDLERAFQVTERLRARVLVEALDAADAMPALAATGPRAERRNAVLDRIADVQRRLAGRGLAEAERAAALQTLAGLEREEAGLREDLARESPGFAALRRPALPSLAEIQTGLGDEEALLAFQVHRRFTPGSDVFEGGSWVWALTRDAVDVYPIPDDFRLAQAVELFLGLFGRRDGSEAAAAGRLYDDLLGSAVASLPPRVARLAIIPDGVLHHVPFAALRGPAGQPLAARYALSQAPSATLWLRWRRQPASAAAIPALALADPEFLGAAQTPSGERAWALAEGLRAGRLPHARREGRHLVRTLGNGSRLLLGADASERFVKDADLTLYGLLHVAAHALLDGERAERSAILLAPGDDREDGLLQIREIVGLDLSDRVVVLSACRSASGGLVGGEGVMGLARGFFLAGARTVVGSLWPLRDDDAERLFGDLYRQLARGESVAAALAAARREQIRAGAPAAAWAGLVVLGDGDVVPLAEGRKARSRGWTPALAVAAAVVLVMAVAFGTRRLRAAPTRSAR